MLGLGSIAKKVFGSPNDRLVKSVRPIIDKINAMEPEFEALDDAGIVAKTGTFDLDHFGAEVSQQLACKWSGDVGS